MSNPAEILDAPASEEANGAEPQSDTKKHALALFDRLPETLRHNLMERSETPPLEFQDQKPGKFGKVLTHAELLIKQFSLCLMREFYPSARPASRPSMLFPVSEPVIYSANTFGRNGFCAASTFEHRCVIIVEMVCAPYWDRGYFNGDLANAQKSFARKQTFTGAFLVRCETRAGFQPTAMPKNILTFGAVSEVDGDQSLISPENFKEYSILSEALIGLMEDTEIDQLTDQR